MGFGRRFFERAYQSGRTRWDSGTTPPELVGLVDASPAGRALDLGCGTGTNALYLASRGWQVVGVDFSDTAIQRARGKVTREHAEGTVTLICGDVTRLASIGVDGEFDLVLDIGCFHGIPTGRRNDYVREVRDRTSAGATLLMFAFPMGIRRIWHATLEGEIRRRFSPAFILEQVDRGSQPRDAAWFMLRRR